LQHLRRRLAGDGYCHPEEFGTQAEARIPDRIEIDCEAHVALLGYKLNHAAILNKPVRIADCKDGLPAQRVKIVSDAGAFRSADVSDGTLARLGRCFEAHYAYGLAVELFVLSKIIERSAERIFAHDTDIEILPVAIRIRRREANEFSKIKR
jgi:hypothetical protein